MTCKECKRSIVVTAHAYTRNFTLPAIYFSMKSSMHEPRCSLRGEPSKRATMAKLPLLGNKVNVNKGAFTAGNHDPPLCVWEQLTGSRKAGTSIVQGFKPTLPFSVRFQWCAQSVSHLFHGPAPR